MFTTLVLAMALATSPVHMEEDAWKWTLNDTMMSVVAGGLMLADTLQTHEIQRRGLEDANPVLGKHPSKLKINTYFLGLYATEVLVSHMLPRPWRTILQGASISIEMSAIGWNSTHGISFTIPW